MLTAAQIQKATTAGVQLSTALDLINEATHGLRAMGFDVPYPATRVAILATIDQLRDALKADRDERLAQHTQRRPAKVAA